MASPDYIQSDFHMDGPVELLVQDRVTGFPVRLGRILDPEFQLATTHNVKKTVRKNKIYTVDQRAKEVSGTIKGTWLEFLNPTAMQLFLGEYGDAQTVTTGPLCNGFTYHDRLYGTNVREPIEDAGWATATNLQFFTSAIATYGTAGGSGWTTGPNYFWTLPYYLYSPSTTAPTGQATTPPAADTQWLNVDKTGYFTTGDGVASGSVSVLHVHGHVTIAVILPALNGGQPLPDGYVVFHNTSNSLTTAKCLGFYANTITRSGGTQNITLTGPANAGSTPFGGVSGPTGGVGSLSSRRVQVRTIVAGSYATGTPTYTTRIYGTDYTWDPTSGHLSRVSGGAILDGEEVEVTVWAIRASEVINDIGGGSPNTDYRQMWLMKMDVDNTPPQGETVLAEGLEALFYRAQCAGLAFGIKFNEADFTAGSPFEIMVDIGSQGKIGIFKSRSRKHLNYEQKFS